MEEDFYETEITDEDYGFVFDSDGNLKSVFLPDAVPFKPPRNIAKILKICGIHDIDNINGEEPLH
jgi:hypothetical protein